MSLRRLLTLLLSSSAMLLVAMFSAFLAMRLSIHGREVEVPSLAGMTLAEASRAAERLGLSVRLENKFYSADVPSGHVLGQFPAPGASVRHEWAIRVTESLGPQQVSIPDVVGQDERPASLGLRRASLEVGTLAELASPGSTGIVLAQTPPPNASGVDRPRVSLLLSEPESADPSTFVMPQLIGLSLSTASSRAAALGLRAINAEDTSAPATPALEGAGGADDHSGTQTTETPTSPETTLGSGLVTAQSPLAGHRIARGEVVRLTIGH